MGQAVPVQHHACARERTFRFSPISELPPLLARLGFDGDAILAEAGFSPEVAMNSDFRVPFTQGFRLLDRCAALTGRRDIGLLLGASITPAHLGMPGELVANAATLRSALDSLIENIDLHDEGSVLMLREEGAYYSLFHCMHAIAYSSPSLIFDLCMAVCCNVIRSVCGENWSPCVVYLQAPNPQDRAVYEQFFGCTVYFNSPHCELVFPAADMDRVNPLSNPQRHKQLQQQALQLHERVIASDGLLKTLPMLIRRGLLSGAFTAADIAGSIGLNERTLHRRLASLGTNYRELLQQTRQVFANHLLSGTQLPVYDIATALGYADAPAFVRAFHRWSDISPLCWRERHQHAASIINGVILQHRASYVAGEDRPQARTGSHAPKAA